MTGLAAVFLLAAGCSVEPPPTDSEVTAFLRTYNAVDQQLRTVSETANWKAATDVTAENTGARIGAEAALASFRGSRFVIDRGQRYLDSKEGLTDLQFRQLDRILLNAAESPGTVPDVVQARIRAAARLSSALDGFEYCRQRTSSGCAAPITPNEIDDILISSRDLKLRRETWEISKQSGPVLKPMLLEARDLRNELARELGYSSYFHLQVADYGMSVGEMMDLLDTTVAEIAPLYDQLHGFARRMLAKRYDQEVPETIPAHWLGNRWGQAWPGLVEGEDLDALVAEKSPEWIVKQAEQFYQSIGMGALPDTFWDRSDLYQLPPGSTRRKNTHASSWHIDRKKDVRCLMSVTPTFRWFESAHHELGHVYYHLAYSNRDVPPVLRDGLNRAFHEAIGALIGMSARQESYLKEIELLPGDREPDRIRSLLSEALDDAVVFLPWSAGVMAHFEHDLYEEELQSDELNQRWWELVEEYQKISPPARRGEEYCDGCTKTHIIDDPARYYDYALATILKYQLHDYIAREILHQDPYNCNYYGHEAVGEWLMQFMRLGATQGWRTVLKEMTGEELSPRAMVAYFQPLNDYLPTLNGAE